jgi:hypothetical protein
MQLDLPADQYHRYDGHDTGNGEGPHIGGNEKPYRGHGDT